ncbi:MAG: ATP-binding protein [Pseudomonadota bacterium]
MTIAEHQTTTGKRPDFELSDTLTGGLRSVVGRRFAFATITCSTVIAFFMTLIQLTADFKTEQTQQNASIAKIEDAILPALAESVWVLDDILINAQLSGIAQIEGVNRVEIIGAEDVFVVTNETEVTNHRIELPILRQTSQTAQKLGTLVVDVNYAHIWDQVVSRAAIVLGTNFLKTLCVAFILLFLFQRLIGRHLLRLVTFADGYDPRKTGQRLQLEDTGFLGGRRTACEFDKLQASVNRWSQATETYLDQLRNTNQEQAEFSYAVSHDLKSPANTMSMLLEELEGEVTLEGDARVIVDDMRTTNKRMGDLVTDILDYSRLVDGQLEKETVHIAPLIAEIELDLYADIHAADATIEYGDLPSVMGHGLQIQILLQNLLANAIKFRHPDRPALIRVTGEKTADGCVVRVADNGIGIPEKFHDKVFSLFTKLHTRSEYDGTGLGLSISRRVMSNHGGSVWVEDGLDGGTTFALKFPRMPDDQTH